MKRVKNLDQWYKVTGPIVFDNPMGGTHEVELNPIGPCVARLQLGVVEDGKFKPDKGAGVLLGLIDQLDGYQFTVTQPCAVHLEAQEVWARRDQTPVAVPFDPESPSFTRLEKAGLFVDEIDVLLHRQSVLQRLSASQALGEERQKSERLERRLDELVAQITALTPKVETPEPPAEENKVETPSK